MPKPVPQSLPDWLDEIVAAYRDAAETIPFGPLAGTEIDEGKLFHLAPLVCLKFRGLKRTPKTEKRVTEGALSTYVANRQVHGPSRSHSIMAFTLCYAASHYALDLIAETECEAILEYVGQHLEQLEVILKV